MQCLECGKDLIQITGKRAKQFCNVTCRSNYWQKKKRDSEPKKQGLPGRPPKKKIDKLQEQIADAAEARNNSLINAARGRDANGVNQDESNLAEKETKITDKKKLASAIRKQPMVSKEVLVPFPDEEFMGHPIPKGLKGIELSIWKAEIKEKHSK